MQTIHYYLTDNGISKLINNKERKEMLADIEKILLEMYRTGIDTECAEELK